MWKLFATVLAISDTGSISVSSIATDFADRAEAASIKALSLDPQHALAHMVLGGVQMCTRRALEGLAQFEHALSLNPNLAEVHSAVGVAKLFLGRPAETEAHVLEALRVSPRDDGIARWPAYVGVAKLHLGADDEAVEWLRRSMKANPNYPVAHFMRAAALALLGRTDEAVAAKTEGLALDPAFSIRRLKNFEVSDDPIFLAWDEAFSKRSALGRGAGRVMSTGCSGGRSGCGVAAVWIVSSLRSSQ